MALDLIAVLGPTACGKTRRGVELARRLDGEIISADSRQVYRDMSIGTGKDLEEYGDTPYHLIDVCEAGEKYNLHRFLRDAREALAQIRNRGKMPVLCGGSGMYAEALLNGLQLPDVPENPVLRQSLSDLSLTELTGMLSSMKTLHNTTDVDTCQRAIRAIEIERYYADNPCESLKARKESAIKPEALIIGIDIPRDDRRRLISQRLKTRLASGMIEETEALLRRGIPADDLIYYGLEYKYLTLYITGRLSRGEMQTRLETAIHQFAKRQMTWLRGMERRGFTIHWLRYDLSTSEFISSVRRLMQ